MACSLSSVFRTPNSAVRTAVAAAEAVVRGPVVDDRKWALACTRGHVGGTQVKRLFLESAKCMPCNLCTMPQCVMCFSARSSVFAA